MYDKVRRGRKRKFGEREAYSVIFFISLNTTIITTLESPNKFSTSMYF